MVHHKCKELHSNLKYELNYLFSVEGKIYKSDSFLLKKFLTKHQTNTRRLYNYAKWNWPFFRRKNVGKQNFCQKIRRLDRNKEKCLNRSGSDESGSFRTKNMLSKSFVILYYLH